MLVFRIPKLEEERAMNIAQLLNGMGIVVVGTFDSKADQVHPWTWILLPLRCQESPTKESLEALRFQLQPLAIVVKGVIENRWYQTASGVKVCTECMKNLQPYDGGYQCVDCGKVVDG